MSHNFLVAVAAVGAAAIAMPAVADPFSGPGDVVQVSRVVRYNVADLHDVKGARRLAFRIKIAAADVCGGDDVIVRWYDDDFIPCREQAIDRALATLGAPMVSAALGRTSGPDLSSAQ